MKRVYAFLVMDLPHIGHFKLIQKARRLGDYLIVGVLTDEAAASYKDKPIMPLEERMEMARNIKGVDFVIVQEDRDPSENILKYRPDIVVHGDDWAEDTFPAKEAMMEVGARLVLVPYHKGQSTSLIKEKIRG